MSKKNKKSPEHTNVSGSKVSLHAAEYGVIKHDLLRVFYLNVIYLAALLVVFFTDQKSQYLEHWLGKIFHF